MSISIKSSGGGGKGGYDPSGVTATPGDVLQGKTFMAKDGSMQAGAIPLKAAATITPTTSDQKIEAGQYLSGDQKIAAVKLQSKSTSVSAGTGKTIKPDSGYTGLSQVYVSSPAVSVTVNPVVGIFSVGSKSNFAEFYCGVTDPKMLFIMIDEDMQVASTSNEYVVSLAASGSGLSSNHQVVTRWDEENFVYEGGFFTASISGGYIGITLNVDDCYFRATGYRYYVV